MLKDAQANTDPDFSLNVPPLPPIGAPTPLSRVRTPKREPLVAYSFTVEGQAGSRQLVIAETADASTLMLTIINEHGEETSVRLTEDQFERLADLRYKIGSKRTA